MNLIKMFFRDRTEISVNVAEAWEVRWFSRYGQYYGDIRPEIRIFVTKHEANEFADALRDAYRLIRHSSGVGVSVVKQ